MPLLPKKLNFAETWTDLKAVCQKVLNCEPIKRQRWQDSFMDIYSLCIAHPEPFQEPLYESLVKFIRGYVQNVSNGLRETRDGELLKAYYEAWLKFKEGNKFLDELCRHLNQQYVKKASKQSNREFVRIQLQQFLEVSEEVLTVEQVGCNAWKEIVIGSMDTKLQSHLLQSINDDRQGIAINGRALKGTIDSLVEVDAWCAHDPLELYQKVFEKLFVQESQQYFHRTSQTYLSQCSCSEYMKKVLVFIKDEKRRTQKYMHTSTHEKLVKCAEQEFIRKYLEFLRDESVPLVAHENRADLKNLYELLKPVAEGMSFLVQAFDQHVFKRCSEKLQAIDDMQPQIFVESMLEVHGKYQKFVWEVFNNDVVFTSAQDQAMQRAINSRSSNKMAQRAPELVARYCDILLRKSAKGLSESEAFDRLANSITVFKYLDDKDIFQRFYAKSLARRLINGLSMSMDNEESFIDKLKQTCGYEFTNKLHRMFTDVKLNEDLNQTLSRWLKEKSLTMGCGAYFNILQAGAWPVNQSNQPSISLPVELERCATYFDSFYKSNFNGRKLSWLPSLSSSDVTVSLGTRTYYVHMPLVHMVFLLQLNDTASLSISEVCARTRMLESEAVRTAQTLIDAKLLLKPSEPLSGSTIVEVNQQFSNKRTKFKIAAAATKESPQDIEPTHKKVEEDRKLYMQAVIVRTMKARKLLKHSILVEEVISQSRQRFVPNVSMIKKCIEILIDKQYLQRVEGSPDTYTYVA